MTIPRRVLVLLDLSILIAAFAGAAFGRSLRSGTSDSPEPTGASGSNLAVIAYYTQWSVCDMPPQKLDWSAFSHLIYFWGEPSSSPPYFTLTAGSADSTTFETGQPGWCVNPISGKTHQQILLDSARAHGVKLILCVGGEVGTPASNFAAMIADTSAGGKQDQFIAAALGFAQRHGYSGIDIDWEFPSRGTTARANYTRFLNKVRAQLNTWTPRGVLTTALPVWLWWDQAHTEPSVDIATLNADFDYIDIMEYGMQNTSHISHYSPLYPNPAVSQETWTTRSVKEYKAAGVDSSELVTLIPFECIRMTATAPITIGESGGGSRWIGIRDIPPGATTHWDDISKAAWADSGSSFYSFENQTSIGVKVQYARDQHIGGVGIWELWRGWLPKAAPGSQDPLLQMLKASVGGIVIPPPTPTPRIRGQIYFDRNSNGVLDPGEQGIAGWTVHLSGVQSDSTVTDAKGMYSFNNLPLGAYLVTENLPTGWTLTSFPLSFAVTVISDSTDVVANFGDYMPDVYDFASGWNLVSLPERLTDTLVSSVLPTAVRQIVFTATSTPVQAMTTGLGYWAQFPGPVFQPIAGGALPSVDVPLAQGWNLIGSVDHEVPIPTGGIITGSIFGFSDGYFVSSTLVPGRGYWIKAQTAGTVSIGGPGSLSERLVGPDTFDVINFTDQAGRSQTLYLAPPNAAIPLQDYDLPPVPPEGAYDVRFASQRFLESYPAEAGIEKSYPIQVRSPVYPMTVKYCITRSAGRAVSLTETSSQNAASAHRLDGAGSITLNPGTSSTLALTVGALGSFPRQFRLSQNYPNPFNNSTLISFTLPSEGRVHLTVYNVLGESISSLMDKSLGAGDFTVPFDAGRLPSGVYFYRLEFKPSSGGASSSVNRMILMK